MTRKREIGRAAAERAQKVGDLGGDDELRRD